MTSLLSDRMVGSYEALRDDQRLETETSLVKSYIVESTLRAGTDASLLADRAALMLAPAGIGPRATVAVHRTEDPSLLNIDAQMSVNQRTERVVLYADISDPRYWLVHTMGGSTAVDYLMSRLVGAGPDLDRAWLPADFLEAIAALGSFRGLSLDYDRRLVPDVDFAAAGAPPEFLKMQLWGSRAAKILDILRAQGAFPNETTLSKVKLKYVLDEGDPLAFTLDDVKYNGKVTARGTSFDSHLALLGHVIDGYSAAIDGIETHYRVTPSSAQEPFRLNGEPIHFAFDPPIADVAAFCSHVFGGGEPFRLWGVPVQLAHDYLRVEGVDLHVGQTLRCEVSPQLLRLYLPVGACGNSAVRLYTNLQHHYNSQIRVEGDAGATVFTF